MKVNREWIRKGGLVFLAVSVCLSFATNRSRMELSEEKKRELKLAEAELLENQKLPARLKDLKAQNEETGRELKELGAAREALGEELAVLRGSQDGAQKARQRIQELLEQNAFIRDTMQPYTFYGLYDEQFMEKEESGGAVVDKVISFIPGLAQTVTKGIFQGDKETRKQVYIRQSERNEVFRNLFFEFSKDAENILGEYVGELTFYEELLADSGDLEEQIKKEMLLEEIKDRAALEQEWESRRESLIRALARLYYVTELCREVYHGSTLDSDAKELFMLRLTSHQSDLERLLDGRMDKRTPGDYFTEQEKEELLVKALDSYQALQDILASESWYGSGIGRSSMWVNGATRLEIVAWARMDREGSRDMFYVEEEYGSVHYYDTAGRPYKIMAPDGTVYLYQGEVIRSSFDEGRTAAEVEASRWLHDAGGSMDSSTFKRAYYENTARARLGGN